MGVLTRSKKQEQPNTPSKSRFLKVVRPGGQVELFRDPIPAREIMTRFPRHCVTRTDFFDYPWIVVRPDSILVPGEMFFLVPHHTVDKVVKEKKMQQFQHSNNRMPKDHGRSNQHEDRYGTRERGYSDQDSENGVSLYKEMFYESWEEMRKKLEQLHPERAESPLESGMAKPCIRRPGSRRERLNLRVSFSSPIVIPGSRRGTPVHT